MAFKFYVLLACMSVSTVYGQLGRTSTFNLDFNLGLDNTPSTTPVPILRYIDTQNPDGSYTFGYESGDGTYKIETRYPTGEVKGKYGYYDDQGVFREVEYGATPTGGFEPKGNGLEIPDTPRAAQAPVQEQVAAPEVNGRRVSVVRRKKPVDNSNDRRVQLPDARRRQKLTSSSEPINRNLPIRPRPTAQPQQFRNFQAQQPAQRAQPVQPVQAVRPVARPTQQPAFQPQPVAFTQNVDPNRFNGHPAQNIDLDTGSYTIFYSGR